MTASLRGGGGKWWWWRGWSLLRGRISLEQYRPPSLGEPWACPVSWWAPCRHCVVTGSSWSARLGGVKPTERSWGRSESYIGTHRTGVSTLTALQTPSTCSRENISSVFILKFVLNWIKPSQRSIRSITAHQDGDDMMFKVIIKFVKSRSALSLSWMLGGLIVILINRINSNWRLGLIEIQMLNISNVWVSTVRVSCVYSV